MSLSRTAIAIAGLCLLAACGPKPGGNAAAGSASAGGAAGGATAGGPDQVLNFSDLPHPKAGLWQETMDDGDGKPSNETMCLSGKVPNVKMPKGCSQFTLKRTFMGAIVMDMNCAEPEFTMVSHGQITGDMQSQMSSDMTMTMTMKGQPARTTKMHTEAHYLGPCAPGQKPDDESDAGAAS